MRQIRIITHGSQMAMADVFHLRNLIAERMRQEAPAQPYQVETRDSLDLALIEATSAQATGSLVINNAGDVVYWDSADDARTGHADDATCICGHEEEEHGPSGACEVEGCLCACYEVYSD
jgi:hypothetical protein